ncbi:MAG TPA: CHASE3 domain-containing protein [Lacipirellulaceae bacterium]
MPDSRPVLNRGLDRGLIVSISLLVALLIASALVWGYNVAQLHAAAEWVDHTYRVLAALENITAVVRDAESAQRGYVITGNPEFLENYSSAGPEIERLLADFDRLTTDNLTQQARIPELRSRIEARLKVLADSKAVFDQGGFDALKDMIKQGVGRQKMAAVRETIDAMEQDENELLRVRSIRTDHAFYATLIAGAISLVLGLVAVAAFLRLLRRHLQARAEAAAAFWDQREEFRTTLASIGDGVMTTDAQGRVVFMNPVAESLTGWSAAEASGVPLTKVMNIFNEHTRAPAINPVERVLGEGVVVGLANHTILLKKGGGEVPIDDSAAPIRSIDGKVTGCVFVFRDIVERKAAEAEINRLLAREQRRAEQLHRLTDAALTLNSATTRESVENVLREEAKLVLDAERATIHVNGTDGQVPSTGLSAPLIARSGQPFGYLHLEGNNSDAFTEDDAAILKQLAHMAAVAVENAQLYEELHSSNQRKNEFLATLAHELRNPLAPIRNSLELMQIARGDAAALEESRTIIERQVVQMVRLIDDLLDISRISRGKIELRKEPVSLQQVIAAAIESSQHVVREYRHELTTSIPAQPLVVHVDSTRLCQVILNLINNAAKYTNPGGRIAVAVERHGDQASISVSDNGMGIAPQMLERVFEMFAQIDNSLERSQGGLGIGLTIVRRLVEMHGGTVEARSAGRDQGSEFLIRLPLSNTPLIPAGTTNGGRPERSPAAQPRRILAVDDNKDAVDTLAMMLRIMGHDLQTAYDGMEAVDVAAHFKPEIVLLDIGLPRLNGYEVCRRIRELPDGRNAFIVAITGWGQEEDRRRSREAGFDHHLVKPVDPQALEQLLAEASTRTSR